MLITSRLLQMQKLFRKSSQLISNFIKLHKSQETKEMYKNNQQRIKRCWKCHNSCWDHANYYLSSE